MKTYFELRFLLHYFIHLEKNLFFNYYYLPFFLRMVKYLYFVTRSRLPTTWFIVLDSVKNDCQQVIRFFKQFFCNFYLVIGLLIRLFNVQSDLVTFILLVQRTSFHCTVYTFFLIFSWRKCWGWTLIIWLIN